MNETTMHLRISDAERDAIREATANDDMPTMTSWCKRVIRRELRDQGFEFGEDRSAESSDT